jgi:hypothetical protein
MSEFQATWLHFFIITEDWPFMSCEYCPSLSYLGKSAGRVLRILAGKKYSNSTVLAWKIDQNYYVRVVNYDGTTVITLLLTFSSCLSSHDNSTLLVSSLIQLQWLKIQQQKYLTVGAFSHKCVHGGYTIFWWWTAHFFGQSHNPFLTIVVHVVDAHIQHTLGGQKI